jgi:hypothetical protein|tara:strand:- start:21063 stop:21887 length:825 start_codon:yes stop_codon:yes gene_type:complete
MRTEVSIILPTIRKYLWNDFYKSLKNSLHREFELILVTPHKELTQELKDKENIKLITDYGSANRCQQIALCNATGKYIKWAADDELFYENIHDEILDFYEKNKTSYKDVVVSKYYEGEKNGQGLLHTSGLTEMSSWDKYYRMDKACPWLGHAYKIGTIQPNYWIFNHALMETKYMKEMGGFDTSFETTFISHTDLGIRAQNNGSRVLLFDGIISQCSHMPHTTGDHAPIHYAHIQNDEPLIKSIYFDPKSKDRIKININNWEDSPKIWKRRFKR